MTHPNSWQHSNYTVYGITVLFFLLSLWGIMNHELWLDEAHHYLLARDSHSFKDLFFNTRYEGHPITWNLILYWITRITTDPIWMQVLHISIMTLAVGIFLKKAPFSLLFKFLFIFGYFMFYEYNILSRNYNLGILFIFLACTLYEKRDSKFISIVVLLGLASQSHAIFLILASSIMAMIALERLICDKKYTSIKTWIGIFIFATLAIVSVLQIIPPTDTSFFERGENFTILQKIPKSIAPFFKAIFIIPDVTIHSFWNSHILVNYSKPIAGVFAIVSLAIPYFLFYKDRKLVLYMYFGIFATGAFFYITALNAARYYGILYLFLITALWFDAYVTPKDSLYAFAKAKKTILPLSEKVLNKLKSRLIYAILGLHFIVGIYAFAMDINAPFTTAKQTAEYLRDQHYTQKVIASTGCSAAALSTYIERPIYFTSSDNFKNFCTFNQPLIISTNDRIATIKSLRKLVKENTESVIFITYTPFFDSTQNNSWILHSEGLKIVFLEKFDGSIVRKGNHYIYEIFNE